MTGINKYAHELDPLSPNEMYRYQFADLGKVKSGFLVRFGIGVGSGFLLPRPLECDSPSVVW
jgi:hypothetical protein